MFNFIFTFLDFFSPYANSFEKKLDKFLSRLSDNSPNYVIEKQTLELMQQNLVILQLWTERRYKGYKYLHKRQRRELYANVELIKSDFEEFCRSNPIDINSVYTEIERNGVSIQQFQGFKEQLLYLAAIMKYFSPANDKFVYRESSNFGGLLADPRTSKLIGDCNQIVTLYIYFYSLKYDIKDLRIKTLPGHVALHFKNIDIEATNGHFARYNEEDHQNLPIHEIIPVNLLDTTDSYFKTHEIAPTALLESAKLAFLLSSNKQIVEHNLKAAYQTIVNYSVKENKFDQALTYANQSHDQQLITLVGQNAAVHYLQKNEFSSARKFAKYADKPTELEKHITYNEGVYYLNKQEYKKALNIFQKINESELVKQCYIGLYTQLQKKLTNIKTITELKKHRSTLNQLSSYAQKSGDYQLIDHAKSMLEQIR